MRQSVMIFNDSLLDQLSNTFLFNIKFKGMTAVHTKVPLFVECKVLSDYLFNTDIK